jgi:hypothetical protein
MTPFIDKSYRSVAAATITELSCAAVVPVMPAMASDDVGALQVLWALGRNAYSAFPSRCLVEPVVKLRIAGRHLALTCAPDAIGHMFPARAQMMRQFFEQPGVAELLPSETALSRAPTSSSYQGRLFGRNPIPCCAISCARRCSQSAEDLGWKDRCRRH